MLFCGPRKNFFTGIISVKARPDHTTHDNDTITKQKISFSYEMR